MSRKTSALPSSRTRTGVGKIRTSGKQGPPAARGRPPRRVYINVLVRESTRRSLNVLARRNGLTQGELLDAVLSGRLSVG